MSRYTKLIELRFDELLGEGNVKYVNGFDKENFVVKLDLLYDCIYELEQKVEEINRNGL